jgi:DMSO/TMAO reductase YedYZ molybdopterin-dependent catalytic subunit
MIQPRLRSFSRINDWVGEHVLQSGHGLAREYPASARTAMDNFPSYSISYNETREYPAPNPAREWTLNVGGLIRKPLRLALPAIKNLPGTSYTVKHHCVEGWTAIASWSGVPLSTIIKMAEPLASAKYLRFDSFDSGYYNGWDMKSAMHPQTILAYAYNDRPLMMNHGAPLRLYSPIKLGYKLTKYLTGITFTRERPGGYWEDQGYPWFGGI